MNLSKKELSKHFDIESAATSEEIAKIEAHFGFTFPSDYKDFLFATNGIEGSINDEYLVLWGTRELIELNTAYRVIDYIQNVIIIGSDGAEEAFAFELSGSKPIIINFPFIGMGYIPSKKLADTFEEFLNSKLKRNRFIRRLWG